MSDAGPWPGGARGALCLSFDNLGEAAEVGAGARDPGDPLGDHPTATGAVPTILELLASRGLSATFFVEGLNAEVYPELLKRIDSEAHEVAYHAWTHEQWGELPEAAQTENLAHGVEAFERIGLRPSGMRPPGGRLGPGGVGVLRDAGLSYCSPAGAGVAVDDAGAGRGLALLPFEWRHVDAACVLPALGSVRTAMTGSEMPLEPAAFLAYLGAELSRLIDNGGFATFVFHPFLLEWLGEARLAALLDRIAAAKDDDGLWVASCREVAAQVLADPSAFAGGATLDATSWSG